VKAPDVLMRRVMLGWCPPKADVLAAPRLEAASLMACEARHRLIVLAFSS